MFSKVSMAYKQMDVASAFIFLIRCVHPPPPLHPPPHPSPHTRIVVLGPSFESLILGTYLLLNHAFVRFVKISDSKLHCLVPVLIESDAFWEGVGIEVVLRWGWGGGVSIWAGSVGWGVMGDNSYRHPIISRNYCLFV